MSGNNYGYSYTLGQLIVSADKKKADLIINLPFYSQGKFMCFAITEKKTENSPDWIIRLNRCQVGSMWRKTSDKKVVYLSGNILFPGYPGNVLYFSVFLREVKEGKKELAVVYSPPSEARTQQTEPDQSSILDEPEPSEPGDVDDIPF